MPRERDPLSVLYDDFSAEFLSILRSDMYTWHGATVRSPAGDRIDARGLSTHERAVQRSLYYVLNSEITPAGMRWVKNQGESLQMRWRPAETGYAGNFLRRLLRLDGERRRELRGRLTPGAIARGFVPSDGYIYNPAEQAQNLQL